MGTANVVLLEMNPPKEKSTTQKRFRSMSPTPFLSKTYDLVDSCGASHIISWNQEGTGFVVWLPQEFSQFLLPKYFKHSNFSSFIRQLNTYGFKKVASDRWEFRHEKFQKGGKNLLREISRRKCQPSVFPSFLKASEQGELVEENMLEENKNLKKENSKLLLEISQFKELKRNLLDCLSHYVSNDKIREDYENNL